MSWADVRADAEGRGAAAGRRDHRQRVEVDEHVGDRLGGVTGDGQLQCVAAAVEVDLRLAARACAQCRAGNVEVDQPAVLVVRQPDGVGVDLGQRVGGAGLRAADVHVRNRGHAAGGELVAQNRRTREGVRGRERAREQAQAVELGAVGDVVDLRLQRFDLRTDRRAVVGRQRFVRRLYRQLSHALEQRVNLGHRAFGGLYHRDAVLRVSGRLPHTADLRAQTLGNRKPCRVVGCAVDAQTTGQALQRPAHLHPGDAQVTLSVDRRDVRVDEHTHDYRWPPWPFGCRFPYRTRNRGRVPAMIPAPQGASGQSSASPGRSVGVSPAPL